MLIVDAQIHLWNAATPPARGTGRSPLSQEHALKEMDAACRCCHLTPHTRGSNANELCMEAVRAHPDRVRDPR